MISPAQALIALPPGLRDPLVDCFSQIARNFAERRWEPAELNGGKFSEIVFTILDGALGGAYASATPCKRPSASSTNGTFASLRGRAGGSTRAVLDRSQSDTRRLLRIKRASMSHSRGQEGTYKRAPTFRD